MNIAIPIFDRLTALDAVGPYEVLARIPDATVTFIAAEPGPKRTETKMLAIIADKRLDDLPHPEVIVVPGGFGTRPLMHDPVILEWLRGAHETSQWTTSVCTGSLLLGAAGILDGLEATTHWGAMDLLAELRRQARLSPGGRTGQGDHLGGSLVGDRHGPEAGRAHRRR